MRSKKLLACFLVVIVMVFVLQASSFAQEKFLLKGGTAAPTSHPFGRAGLYFKEILEAKSQGRIEVRWFHSGQVGGEMACLNQLKDNVLQFLTISPAISGSLNPKLMTMFTPYLVQGWDNFFEVFLKSEASQILLDALQDFGIQGYGWVPYGFDNLVYKDPAIRKLEDCTGRKFRAAEAATIKGTLQAFGTNTIPLPAPEVYQALQQKVVEGVTTPPGVAKLMRWTDILNHITVSEHLFGTHIFWIRTDAVKNLPPDLQKIVKESIREACLKEQNEIRAFDEKCLDDLKKAGTNIWTLNSDEKSRWIKTTRKVIIEHEKRIDSATQDGRAFMRMIYKALGRDYDKEIYGS